MDTATGGFPLFDREIPPQIQSESLPDAERRSVLLSLFLLIQNRSSTRGKSAMISLVRGRLTNPRQFGLRAYDRSRTMAVAWPGAFLSA